MRGRPVLLGVAFSIAFLLCATDSRSQQKETFDIATYTIPAGWKKSAGKPEAVAYAVTNNAKGTWAQIIFYKSMATMGNAQLDFNTDWTDLVSNVFKTGAATPLDGNDKDGWHLLSGSATFDFNGAESAVALLTMSGYGTRMSVVVQTNTQDYQHDMELFLGSIALTKQVTVTTTPPVVTAPTTQTEASSPFPGAWGMASSEQSAYLVSQGMSGTIKRQYTFNADGTYHFVSKLFRPYLSSLWLTLEEGHYVVTGDKLTIKPAKRVNEEWSKKNNSDSWGELLKTQPGKLESVTYRFSKNYFSGIDETNLVLEIASPTERDGPYNGGSAFNNSYLYGPISPRNPVVELPAGKR